MNRDVKRVVDRLVELGCTTVDKTKHTAIIGPGGEQIAVVHRGTRAPGYEHIRRMWKRVRDLEKRRAS